MRLARPRASTVSRSLTVPEYLTGSGNHSAGATAGRHTYLDTANDARCYRSVSAWFRLAMRFNRADVDGYAELRPQDQPCAGLRPHEIGGMRSGV